ncbi:t-SNARE [Ceraceosorus guamensis]|uniref:t-SNARE n=1 Tax=Ceraceosorus guamensis TaxID=1522189 RepID=A0A316VZ23_9BASI|nr:t-SNARE [Ceraceosorus guamensis]PWN42760.1 t-SNARE [Ceraceosorus guamensis]
MSFNDLERGSAQSPRNNNSSRGSVGRSSNRASGNPLPLYHAPPSDHEEYEFKKLAERMGVQIFKLNANVSAIDKLVELSSGSGKVAAQSKAQSKEGRDWTKQVADLTDTTRSVSTSLVSDMKTLSTLSSKSGSSQHKMTTNKLRTDVENGLKNFQRAQRAGANVTRTALDKERARRSAAASTSSASNAKSSENQVALESTGGASAEGGLIDHPSAEFDEGQEEQEQAQVRVNAGPTQSDLEFQEALISEREAEIQEIEGGIQELNEIFRDLGHIVQEQGGMIDNIEHNVSQIALHTEGADRELVRAHEYQRKAGRRAACLLLIVGIVVAVVLVAALS